MGFLQDKPIVLIVMMIKRGLFSKGFWQDGFQIIEAANGADALSMVEKLPDVVLMDVTMPVMDGFETRIRLGMPPVSKFPF